MKRFLAFLFCLTLAVSAQAAPPKHKPAPPPAAQAQPVPEQSDLAIIATAGDDAISSLDLENRLKMVLVTTDLPDNAETRERLRPQLLRLLIDERLEAQEAAKEKIEVTPDDVTKAIATIERQRNMQPGELEAGLKAHDVNSAIYLNQLKAQIAWNKLIAKKIKPQVKVSEEEIDRSRSLADADNVVTELQIGVLSLAVDKPEREPQVKKLADQLTAEIRGGASFEKVAPQFSSSVTSVQLLNAFWVNPGQLDPAIVEALHRIKPGEITDPVRTPEGYSIVKMFDIRRSHVAAEQPVELRIKNILFKLKPNSTEKDADLMLKIGEQVSAHPGLCTEKGAGGVANPGDYDMEVTFDDTSLAELPDGVRTLVEPLKVGEVSQPVATDDGIRLFMLCARNRLPLEVAEREKVYNLLMQQKLQLEAQKYLRNLRRDAFVDIRS